MKTPEGYVVFAAIDLALAAKKGLVETLAEINYIYADRHARMTRIPCVKEPGLRNIFSKRRPMTPEEAADRLATEPKVSYVLDDGAFKAFDFEMLDASKLRDELERRVLIYESLGDHETMISLAEYNLLRPWLRPEIDIEEQRA